MASRSLCHATLLCVVPEQKMPQMSPWGHQASGQAHDISPQKTDHHWKSIPDPNQWVGTTRASYRPSPQPSFCKEDRKWGIQGLPLPETEAPGVSSRFNQFWPFPFLQAWTCSFPQAWVMVELLSASPPRSFPSSNIIHLSSLSLFPLPGTGLLLFRNQIAFVCFLPLPLRKPFHSSP